MDKIIDMLVPTICTAKDGKDGGKLELEWMAHEGYGTTRFPLIISKEMKGNYPDTAIALESKVIFVGQLSRLPNEHTVSKLRKVFKQGTATWVVYFFVPINRKERPYEQIVLEINTQNQLLPMEFHDVDVLSDYIKGSPQKS